MLVELGHEVVSAGDGLEAMTALLRPEGPRLAVLDWEMPGADGISVCRMLRKLTEPYVYVVLLTSRDRREDMVAALDGGADDFLTKPFDPAELKARLRSGARVVELQDGLLRAQEALRVQATRDHLTGLWNRGAILELLDKELNRAQRQRTPLAVALVDVDRFKEINDAYGHALGDLVLRSVSTRMEETLRTYDLVGRYGGDEFLMILPGCDASIAADVAERVRARVSSEIVRSPQCELSPSLSIGVASTSTFGDVDRATLIQAADEALYRAKARGRNRVEREAA
jgi:diguanylate cyclase (GGDEF)-like protein